MTATRYVTPLKEGGSLPGIVEADDDGTYVLKFRGAGQGLKVLVAEVLVAGIARLLEVPVPDLAVVRLDPRIAKYEADEEVQDLLTASVGTNLGVDFLPGSLGYDGSRPPDADLAERIIWLDALTANVDRTWSNPNLLVWHGRTWAIDHGAALYFHHSWPSKAPAPERFAAQPFDASRHVLRDVAGDVARRHDEPRRAPHARGRRRRGRRGARRVDRAHAPPRRRTRGAGGIRPHAAGPSRRAAHVGADGCRRVNAYQYVLLRLVPRVDREEFINVGVVLYSQDAGFLDAAWGSTSAARTRCRRRATSTGYGRCSNASGPCAAARRAAACRPSTSRASASAGSSLRARPSFSRDRSTAASATTPPSSLERLLDRLVRA